MSDINQSVLPLYKKINDAQSDLFPLSLTAEFKVSLNLGYDSDPLTKDVSLSSWLTKCGVANSPQDLARYDFFASDVTLPGASFDMAESMGDRQGTIERFAQRRLYAPLSVSFYVDANYNVLRLFEEWMNFMNPIHNSLGRYEGSFQGQNGYEGRNNYYKFRYPDDYKRNVIVTKFEKDFYQGLNMNETRIGRYAKSRSGDGLIPGSLLMYQFIDTFPSNIVAIPLTYEGTQITKVTVEFQYLRYNTITNNDAQELYSQDVFGNLSEKNYDNSVIGQLNASSSKSSTVVGFVNGEPYSGPFHEHVNEDGITVKMTGVVHSSVAHNVIYSTLEASLAGASNTSSTDSEDGGGASSTPPADTTAPVAPSNISVTTAANDNTPTITGQAEGGSAVKLFNGSMEIGSGGATSSGSFSITVANPLADGTYSFTVTATDAAGNVSNTSTIAHTIDTSGGGGSSGGDGGGSSGGDGGGSGYGGGY